MTSRLEEAIKRLPPEKVEQLADYAEFLAARNEPVDATPPPDHMNLDWIGAAGGLYPEHKSGVDAQHAAAEMRIEKLKRAGGE